MGDRPRTDADMHRLVEAIRIACLLADSRSGGHFTLMKFSSGWGATFMTPNNRQDIGNAGCLPTAVEAIERAIALNIGGGA